MSPAVLTSDTGFITLQLTLPSLSPSRSHWFTSLEGSLCTGHTCKQQPRAGVHSSTELLVSEAHFVSLPCAFGNQEEERPRVVVATDFVLGWLLQGTGACFILTVLPTEKHWMLPVTMLLPCLQ